MATTVFPVAVASSSGSTANAITCATPNTMYSALTSFDPGVYTITCAASTVAKVEFYYGDATLITLATTASGTVAINLASAADRVRLWTNTGTNVVVTITKTANSLTNIFSGTLDTVNATGNYTGTSTSGFAYVALVGGGGGGGGGQGSGSGVTGGGGGGGGLAEKVVALTGSMSVVIGAGGNGGTQGSNGNAGGSSTFAGMTANGGNGGNNGGNGGTGGSGSGGSFNSIGNSGGNNPGGGGGTGGGGPGTQTYTFIGSLSGGTGGGGSYNGTASSGNSGKVFILKF